jgi:NAD(P)-dependent dehydrogenase (short-subunit alcohol dehydrogenase family)
LPGPVLILGASGGIGSAIARRLSRSGGRIVLHGRNRDRLETLARDLPQSSVETADVTKESDVAELASRLKAQHGQLSGAVYSIAATFPNKLAHRTKWDVFERQIATQIKGLHLCAASLLPLLESRDVSSRLVVVSTEFVLGVPPVKTAPYVAAKAALTAYARVIAQEWLDKGVRVHILAPGMVKTDLIADIPDEFLQQVAEGMPEKRLTAAEDVAETAAFLMSDAADPLYGTPIHVSRAARR